MQSFASEIKSKLGDPSGDPLYRKRTSYIEFLMKRANGGDNAAREELIKIVTPYAEKVAINIISNEDGFNNISKRQAKKEAGAAIDSLLGKDNYQIVFKRIESKWYNLRFNIKNRVRQKLMVIKNSQQLVAGGEEHYGYYRSDSEKMYHTNRLIAAINTGNDDARGELIAIIKPNVEKTAKRMAHELIGGDLVDEDIISEAVTNALCNALPGRGERQSPLELNRIERAINSSLHNELSTIVQKQERSRVAEAEFARQNLPASSQPSFDLSNTEHSPERDLINKQTKEALGDAVGGLKSKHRKTLQIYSLEEIKLKEAAKISECTQQNVSLLRKKAIKTLRDDISKFPELSKPSHRKRIIAMRKLNSLHSEDSDTKNPNPVPSDVHATPEHKILENTPPESTISAEFTIPAELSNLSHAELLKMIRDSEPKRKGR